MALYGDNVVPIGDLESAQKFRRHLQGSDYVTRKIDELVAETGQMDLDDATARQIIKYQSRLMLSAMIEKVMMGLSQITPARMQEASLRDITSMTVGLTGRIDTLMNLVERISAMDGSDADQFIAKLRTMERAEAMMYLRQEFQSVFETIFTDEERGQVFRDLEDQVALDKLGVTNDGDVRAAAGGQEVGSSQWVPKSRPSSVLPPPQRSD